MEPSGEGVPILEVCEVVKYYGDFAANDHVSMQVHPGRIHALLGENGAGKSTLVKIMYGALQPSSGQLYWEGRRFALANPAEARALGIAMIFQHFSLFEALTVTENIALALPGPFDLSALTERVGKVSADYGLTLEPWALVADLSVGERQRIEIVRCLLAEPKLLIMDEPTTGLDPVARHEFWTLVERLRARGALTVVVTTHLLDEAQRTAALRLGLGMRFGAALSGVSACCLAVLPALARPASGWFGPRGALLCGWRVPAPG